MRRLISGIFILSLSVISLGPAIANAQSLEERESQFCSSLSSRIDDIQNGFNEKIADYVARSDKQSEEAAGRRIIADESLQLKHKEYDELYQQWRQQALASAQGDERNSAVNKFTDKVSKIVEAQRQEYADIRNQFRSELDEIKSVRRQEITVNAEDFSRKAEVALELAKVSCSRQREPRSETRNKLVKSLESARLSYAEFRRNQSNYEDQIKQAVSRRNQSAKAVKQKFEQSFMQASQEFKPEIKNQIIESSPELDS